MTAIPRLQVHLGHDLTHDHHPEAEVLFPEDGLHAARQWDAFVARCRAVSSGRDVVRVVTHSEHLIADLAEEIAMRRLAVGRVEVTAHHGVSATTHVIDEEGYFVGWPRGFADGELVGRRRAARALKEALRGRLLVFVLGVDLTPARCPAADVLFPERGLHPARQPKALCEAIAAAPAEHDVRVATHAEAVMEHALAEFAESDGDIQHVGVEIYAAGGMQRHHHDDAGRMRDPWPSGFFSGWRERSAQHQPLWPPPQPAAWDDEDLVRRVVASAGAGSTQPRPHWSYVAHLFAVGSTRAQGLCQRFGFDPDAAISRNKRPVAGAKESP